MIVIVNISLNLIDRVIRNHSPPGALPAWVPSPQRGPGAQPRWGPGAKPRSGEEFRGTSEAVFLCQRGYGGNPVDCPLPSTADVVGAIKSTLNQQPNIYLTLNIHTEGARKRGGRVNPLWVDAPPMRARLSQYGQPAAINAINNKPQPMIITTALIANKTNQSTNFFI